MFSGFLWNKTSLWLKSVLRKRLSGSAPRSCHYEDVKIHGECVRGPDSCFTWRSPATQHANCTQGKTVFNKCRRLARFCVRTAYSWTASAFLSYVVLHTNINCSLHGTFFLIYSEDGGETFLLNRCETLTRLYTVITYKPCITSHRNTEHISSQLIFVMVKSCVFFEVRTQSLILFIRASAY